MFFDSLTTTVKRILIVVLILNLLAIGLHIYLSMNVNQKINELSSSNIALKKMIEKEAILKIVSGNINNTLEERERTDSYFVGSKKGDVVNFVEKLESLVSQDDLDLEVNSIILDQNDENEIQKMKISLSVGGRWSDIIYFLTLLENIPYKIEFSQIGVGRDIGSLEKRVSKWSASVVFNVLKFKEKSI